MACPFPRKSGVAGFPVPAGEGTSVHDETPINGQLAELRPTFRYPPPAKGRVVGRLRCRPLEAPLPHNPRSFARDDERETRELATDDGAADRC